jgi:ABC-type cobalamin/Fe3+-siderophores transport system ATPase subunit
MLTITSLRVAYGPKVVLQDISLDISPGKILALIGPNGAGKTTIVRAVSGITPILSGQVFVNGQDLTKLKTAERARVLAVVPQARQLGGAYTVEQAVMMGRTAHMSWLGRESTADYAAVRLALQQTQLEAFAQRQIAQLSGGEQQRVFLARALAQSTPVLLLDEPTNHLDLQHQTNLLSLVKKLTEEKQLAVMMAMHDLNLVSFFADKVALLVNGELKHFGTPQEVIQADHISDAYQTPVEIVAHPITGAPLIFPQGILKS